MVWQFGSFWHIFIVIIAVMFIVWWNFGDVFFCIFGILAVDYRVECESAHADRRLWTSDVV